MKIELQALEHAYPGGDKALDGVDLTLDGNEPVAIIGQNGAGKTTLVKHFNGILRPTGGKVLIDGIDVNERSTAEWSRSVGYVFQNPDDQLFLESVRKEFEFGPRQIGMSDQDIADVAAYYEALGKVEGATELPAPREPSAQVAQLLQKGACVSCHGDNYSKPIDPSYPKIAGQYPDYLYAALRAYRDDSHATWGRGNPVMAGMAKQFSDPELKAMARYIASLPGEVRTVPQSRFR